MGLLGGNIADMIQSSLNTALNEQLKQVCERFNVPQTWSPYDGVFVSTIVTNITCLANEFIKLDLKGNFAIQLSNGTNVSYVDTNGDDAKIAPPNSWPPFVSHDTKTGETYILLNGLRLTSTLFTALMWAADVQGYLTPTYNFTVYVECFLVFFLNFFDFLCGFESVFF